MDFCNKKKETYICPFLVFVSLFFYIDFYL